MEEFTAQDENETNYDDKTETLFEDKTHYYEEFALGGGGQGKPRKSWGRVVGVPGKMRSWYHQGLKL